MTLIALLPVALVVGVVDLATANGLSAAVAIDGAACIVRALVGFRSATVLDWSFSAGRQ